MNHTTKKLYETIGFRNEEGGVWRQGWDLKYTGDEWNERKLRVFVIPHSHNDPGWLQTVDEYYQSKTKKILTNIVNALKENEKRRFIWEEISYLSMWWEDATEQAKTDLRKLVLSGQLEIVGGGWVMNDEANSHYFAIIEQIIEGNTWLYDHIGVVPRNAWAIDPFGHSPTMAYLYKRMDFQNMLIQRTHYEVKKALARKKNLEFMWRQSWDTGNRTDILCHMMPFYSYDIPHTCGPDPSVCCQFDFGRYPLGHSDSCPWGFSPVMITPENVEERSHLILDQWRKKATLYRTNTVLIPLGDDFRYAYDGEANLQYENYERIFEYINQQTELKANCQFGTLGDYFTAVREELAIELEKEKESERMSGKAREGKDESVALPLPVLSGDFFTYSDVRQDYWSGYYTSRPFYKSVDRVLEATLRGAEILMAIATVSEASNQKGLEQKISIRERHGQNLVKARRHLALFQHHDGVTGTAKNHVVNDYGNKMHSSLTDLQKLMCEALTRLLSPKNFLKLPVGSVPQDPNFFHPESSRNAQDVLPTRLPLEIKRRTLRHVAVYNSLEETVDQVISVVVTSQKVGVINANGECISCQLNPDIIAFSGGELSGQHKLFWRAKVPPLGVQIFFVGSVLCPKPYHAKIEVFNGKETGKFNCSKAYPCQHVPSVVSETVIGNKILSLTFDTTKGILKKMKVLDESMDVDECVSTYSTRKSGAYLFDPIGQATPRVREGGVVIVMRGPLLEELHSGFAYSLPFSPLVRTARVYSGQGVQSQMAEMFHTVQMDTPKADNLELIIRYKTNISSNGVFFSDMNGFQMARREFYTKIPLQGNYYPMPSQAFIQDPKGIRLTVHTKQAVGVASLEDGQLEMMMDRRLPQDDNRGLGQGVTDNHPIETTFHLLLEFNASETAPVQPSTALFPSLLSHRVGAQLNYPLFLFIGKDTGGKHASLKAQHKKRGKWSKPNSFIPVLVKDLPCDYHIVNFKLQRPIKTEGLTSKDPKFAFILQRRAWDSSFNPRTVGFASCDVSKEGKVDMSKIFLEMRVKNLTVYPLNLVLNKTDTNAGVYGQDVNVFLGSDQSSSSKLVSGTSVNGQYYLDPMEIGAVMLDLLPS